jgi:hypothetical protein
LMGRTMKGRTFAVGAYVGRKAAGWPFARLDVSDDRLTVRCWPLPWFRPRTVSKEEIAAVEVGKNTVIDHLSFQVEGGAFEKVSIDLPVRPKRVIRELKARGYVVVDSRSWTWGLPGGVVPWSTEEPQASSGDDVPDHGPGTKI